MNLRDLVPRAARVSPDAVAVADLTGTLTYAQLEARAAAMAAALTGRGVGRGDRVVLWAQKSVELVAAMQAVLRVGAVYVPVSPVNPPDRVRRIAADCAAVLLITDRPDEPVGPPAVTTAALDADPGAPPVPVHPDDPVYLLYTSGSTGAPKGVVLTDRNATAFVEWACAATGLGPDDRLANHASFTFDLSVFDLYAAFRAGARVQLIPETLGQVAPLLIDLVEDAGITVWYSVPSVLIRMMDAGLLDRGPGRLRCCVFAGEPFPLPALKRLRAAWPGVRMFNWYGPTETNVCTSYEVTAADLTRTGPLPIGVACSGDTVEVAGDGEILVTGPTVTPGYWGQPRHTGPYRTGDLGRRDPDGLLHYLGRRDDLAKVRGHRVEPGEIEAVLGEHPGVDRATVLITGAGPEARIHAVVRPRDGCEPGLAELRRFCAGRLPPYLLLDALHLVEALPVNANGKVDRSRLARDIHGGGTR